MCPVGDDDVSASGCPKVLREGMKMGKGDLSPWSQGLDELVVFRRDGAGWHWVEALDMVLPFLSPVTELNVFLH